MKILRLALLSLAVCPLFGQLPATIGYHRIGQVLTRASSGVNAQIVPYATISVTVTNTATAAVIYSDPLLTSQTIPPLLTADASGNYDYYIPLNYCVTETISAPGQGLLPLQNICINSSGGSSGVSQIIAGTNVTISPVGGTGAVTINSSGGGGSFLPLTGGTLTGPLAGTSASFSGTLAEGTALPVKLQ